MLKYRILTALVLIPLVLGCIFYLPWLGFASLTTVLMGLAAWEWSHLLFKEGVQANLFFIRASYVLSILIICLLSYFIPPFIILLLGLLWWLMAIILVFSYPKFSDRWGQGWLLRGVMGVFALVPCWTALNVIHFMESGAALLMFILIVIWAADTGAYFVGKYFGRVRLLPAVSPKKTVEGALGGLVLSILVVVIARQFILTSYPLPGLLLLAVISVIFSIIGDLLESALKRKAHVKDSGGLLPGHGGILDRIDSMLAALPIFALGALIIF